MSSNQGQTSQNPDQDIEQLENIIQQLKVEIDNINANIRCRHLAHITIRFLNILIQRAEEKIRILRQNQNKHKCEKQYQQNTSTNKTSTWPSKSKVTNI